MQKAKTKLKSHTKTQVIQTCGMAFTDLSCPNDMGVKQDHHSRKILQINLFRLGHKFYMGMFLDTFRIFVDNCEKTNQGVDFSIHCTLKGSLLGRD